MILDGDDDGYWIKPCCTKSIGYFSWCKNIYEALEYSVGKNKERFAKEVGVSVDDLNATYRVLRNI